MWDAVTSRQFRDAPFKTVGKVISPEDPLVVLRADPPRSGDERAKAMHRLKEPIRNKGTQQDQDQIVELLGRAATADPSPVLRFAAIEALGRFEDERAIAVLLTAYQKADGRPEAAPAPPKPAAAGVIPVGGLSAGRAPTRGGIEALSLTGPVGYAPDTVATLRCRCLESLGNTNKLEAARFLSAVAGSSGPDVVPEGSDAPEVRQAAVRGLGKCRQPEAVVALATVLSNESGKDPALVRGAHQGLVHLTGKKLPPDPQKWGEVVQAGVTIAPEPTWVENAIQTATFWEKK
jgi:HEAT repeat protein